MLNFLKSIFRIARSLLIALILTLLIVFMVNNRDLINLNFYPLPTHIEMRVFLLAIICFVTGTVFGFLIFSSKSLFKSFLGYFSPGDKKARKQYR
jgi:uncharacterized integral membrane protein